MPLNITEIFYSIQGESLDAGLPCVFVRLTGCNLRCRYCDTAYAYDKGRPMSVDDIVETVSSYGATRVEITGGEPLLQGETPILVRRCLDNGYRVLMETNGSFDISLVDRRCIRIVDIKCPSSGERNKNDFGNMDRLTPSDQIKFVLADKNDYDYARQIILEMAPPVAPSHILFSPVTGILDPALLAQWMLDDHSEFRLHLQLHKMLWPDKDRGV